MSRPLSYVAQIRANLPGSSLSSKKRSRDSMLSSDSSDAPFFSSDDLADASANNYASPRKKKQYQRAWYEDEDPSKAYSHKAMRTASKLPKDSGVYMSSDSNTSSSSVEEGFALQSLGDPLSKHQLGKMETFTSRSALSSQQMPPPPTAESLKKTRDDGVVKQIVQMCLDETEESIDLSGENLEHVSGYEILRLKQLIREPMFPDVHSVSEKVYSELTAHLKIYLYRNSLRKVPPALMELGNLTVLSLRHNQITELPQSIGGLWEMYELNVAANQLRWLPWELLRLFGSPAGKLYQLHVRPNPLFEPCAPVSADGYHFRPFADTTESANENVKRYRSMIKKMEKNNDDGRHDGKIFYFTWAKTVNKVLRERLSDPDCPRIRWPRKTFKSTPIFLGMTPIAYFDRHGRVLESSPTPPSLLSAEQTVLAPTATRSKAALPEIADSAAGTGGVRTLFEMALHASVQSNWFRDIERLLPHDVPDLVAHGVEAGKRYMEDRRLCSVCGKPCIMPRAEWIEYWHCSPDNLVCSTETIALPVLRRACTWGCAHPTAFRSRKPF